MKLINPKSFKLFLLAGLLACGLVPALASATPVTFDINGHYNIASPAPLSGDFTGTMDVDTATGQLLSFEVLFPGLAAFNDVSISVGIPVFRMWWITAGNGNALDYLQLIFSTPQAPSIYGFGPGSLVDFAGGSIFSGDSTFGSFAFGLSSGIRFFGDFSGDITPARVSVSEPAELGMFGLGLALIGLFAGLRRRTA